MSESRPSRTLYTGDGVGGPADGIKLVSRFPKGLLIVDRQEDIKLVSKFPKGPLIVDRQKGLVYVYDFEPVLSPEVGRFVVREEAGRGEDVERRFRAALGSDYDVISIGAVKS